VPVIEADAGDQATRRFLEFFAATIRNKNTRLAYLYAVGKFFAWCEHHRIGQLADIEPLPVAAYIEALGLTGRSLRECACCHAGIMVVIGHRVTVGSRKGGQASEPNHTLRNRGDARSRGLLDATGFSLRTIRFAASRCPPRSYKGVDSAGRFTRVSRTSPPAAATALAAVQSV
jgi:hypothetical protein